ncbi:MAG: hypothetical protein QM817_06840 [Archangium sp.]
MRFAVVAFLALAACAPPDCSEWSAAKKLGTFDTELSELSGLVASRAQPGILYAHNDSGDSARFFATSTTGKTITEFLLSTGATNVDWEDIALGPCPAGTCVFIADTGDNDLVRDELAVYRMTEPTGLLETGVSPKKSINAEKFRFAYPDTRHDAEALLVHPTTGRVYVITKEGAGERSRLFRFPEPLDVAAVATLEEIGKLPVPTNSQSPVTAADVSPSGQRVLVRMGIVTVELSAPVAKFEDFRNASAVTVPTVVEPQGEAVAFSADGGAIFTSSEVPGGPPLDGCECAAR